MGIPRSRSIRHDLMCTDVLAATRFYTALFGWETKNVNVMGTCIKRLSQWSRTIGAIIPLDTSLGRPSHWVPYVFVANVDDCCKRVRELGGRVCTGTTDFPPGKSAIVTDPQGALFSPFMPTQRFSELLPARLGDGEFGWDELMTTDMPASKAFYRALFGWECEDDDRGPMGRRTRFCRGHKRVAGMSELPTDSPSPPHWLWFVSVIDAAENLNRAGELGGTTLIPVTEEPYTGWEAVVHDPAGAVIGLFEPICHRYKWNDALSSQTQMGQLFFFSVLHLGLRSSGFPRKKRQTSPRPRLSCSGRGCLARPLAWLPTEGKPANKTTGCDPRLMQPCRHFRVNAIMRNRSRYLHEREYEAHVIRPEVPPGNFNGIMEHPEGPFDSGFAGRKAISASGDLGSDQTSGFRRISESIE